MNDKELEALEPTVAPIDPMKALDVIRDALSGKLNNPELGKQAILSVLKNYEVQLRIFLVGVAKTRINRVLRAMELLESVETELFKPERVSRMSTSELIKTYQIANAVTVEGLDYIRKVADMRAELERLGAAANLDEALADATRSAMDGLPPLNPSQRDNVRVILGKIMDTAVVLGEGK